MAKVELPDEFREQTRLAWARYLDFLNPFRPELHRYCRRLTGDLWEAEDLVQDTLVRGFASLGVVHRTIENPRGYLVRIASNLWIDAQRRRGVEAGALATAAAQEAERSKTASPDHTTDLRDAGAALMQLLSPRQRAAVLMKDVFDMSLAETAEALGTSVGAVKAALHRGRSRLEESGDAAIPSRPVPDPAVVDRFVACMIAADLPGLLETMADTGVIETVGSLLEVGRDQFSAKGSWLWQSVHVHPEMDESVRPPRWRTERGDFRGEPVMLSFTPFQGEEWLASITRFETGDGRVTRVRAYYFCPETMREVADELGARAGHVLYRFPFEAVRAAGGDDAGD